MLELSLPYDHRIVDGAARYLAQSRNDLETGTSEIGTNGAAS